jgi:hypothetical protein
MPLTNTLPRGLWQSRFGRLRRAPLLAGAIFAVVLGTSVTHAGQLTLTWTDNSGGLAAFNIERKTGTTETYAWIAQQEAGVVSYVDGTVASGTMYCYRVQASNSAGTSGYSNEACASAVDSPSVVMRADFNNDSRSDILWRESGSGLNAIWQMDGTTVSSGAFIPSVSAGWNIGGVGDFNADGKSDILWRNTSTGENAIWLMNGFTRASSNYIPGVPAALPGWTIAGVGDFNADGKSDILWRNTSTGENAIWLMNGFTRASSNYIPGVPGGWSTIK